MSSFLTPSASENALDPGMLFQCLIQKRMGAAAILAKSFETSLRPDVLFNIGLVHAAAGDAARALEFFDRALAEIRKSTPTAMSLPRPANYQTLRKSDMDGDTLLKPIDAPYIAAFPALAREDMMAAAAMVAHRAGLADRANGYAAGLSGAEFDTFKNGLK